jgi:hypothetical protein
VSAPANPYVGLRPFEDHEAHLFFGRREQTVELLQRLHDGHFLAVVGSSGCGKSSLVRAGLVPALRAGFLVEDRDRWQVATMTPGDAPMAALAGTLAEAFQTTAESWRGELAADPLETVVRRVTAELGKDTNLLLLVDQFEEIFAFRGREDEEQLRVLTPEERRERQARRTEAADFVELLLALARRRLPVYVVLTMRSDFLGDCDLFLGLPEAMNEGQYLVPRLGRSQLREVIVAPALLARGEPGLAPERVVTPRLRDALLNELGERTDRLPVLQHALLHTWDAWQKAGGDGALDLKDLEEAGGLDEALSRDAEEALDELAREGVGRHAVRRIFQRLTAVDPAGRRVRSPASFGVLAAVSGAEPAVVEKVVASFRGGGRSFLRMTEGPSPEGRRVAISHESLIRQWGTLRGWVDEERETRDSFRGLAGRAERWARGDGDLLQDLDIRGTLRWWDEVSPTWAERYERPEAFGAVEKFLKLSIQTMEKGVRERRRRRRLTRGVTLAVVGVLAALTGWAWVNQTERSALRARDQTLLAVAGEFEHDPTTVAALLVDMERPAETTLAAQRMINVLQRKLALEELRHDGPVSAASFSPDGQRVVTASDDKTARIWDLSDPKNPIVLKEHGHGVLAASFSPDGQRVVTASADKTARVWDLSDPKNPIVLEGHGDWVRAASFSPDGLRVVTASDDKTARVWDLRAVTALLDGAREWPYYQPEDLQRLLRASTHVCLTSDFRQRHLGELPEEAARRVAACEAAAAAERAVSRPPSLR